VAQSKETLTDWSIFRYDFAGATGAKRNFSLQAGAICQDPGRNPKSDEDFSTYG
jgi:hypothetical protein